MIAVIAAAMGWSCSGSGQAGGGASGSPRPTTRPTVHRHRRSALPKPVGQPLLTRQGSLIGHVRGTVGGYTSEIVVTDATRSLKREATGTLVNLAGIGPLRVICSGRPHGRFALTHFARGEGPPSIRETATTTHGRASLADYTRDMPLTVPAAETARQRIEHWEVEGGGEAFQFTATVTALLTATTSRCDLLATATVVTHGPFYRYARARPTG